MTEFDKAMNDYFDHFGTPYPYAIGIGFPGSTDETVPENMEIIMQKKGMFCTSSITGPPSAVGRKFRPDPGCDTAYRDEWSETASKH